MRVLVLLLCCACSPEADRTRGGGPGADPGNRRADVLLHDEVDPYHRTPAKREDP